MGFISVKQYTPKLQLLSMFFGSKNQTKKKKSCNLSGRAWETMVNTFAPQTPAINDCPHFFAVCGQLVCFYKHQL